MLRAVAPQSVQRSPTESKVALEGKGTAAGAAPQVSAAEAKAARMAYVMRLLVETYGYPEAGAAGLVGNLFAESGLLANRVEGSKEKSPMTATNAQGVETTFTPEEVMARQFKVRGPRDPGVGLAQWTTPERRAGLFQHKYNGAVLGAAILNNLDAQVDYLVKELGSQYKGVDQAIRKAKSVEDASDEVLFNFERPRVLLQNKTDANGEAVYKTRKNRQGDTVAVLDKEGNKTPLKALRSRTDPAVQDVLRERRTLGLEALAAYRAEKGKKKSAPAAK